MSVPHRCDNLAHRGPLKGTKPGLSNTWQRQGHMLMTHQQQHQNTNHRLHQNPARSAATLVMTAASWIRQASCSKWGTSCRDQQARQRVSRYHDQLKADISFSDRNGGHQVSPGDAVQRILCLTCRDSCCADSSLSVPMCDTFSCDGRMAMCKTNCHVHCPAA